MKISTKGRYALRLMLDLAEHNTGEYIALKDTSARQGISVKYLEQIVTQLSRAGFLRSTRGPQGGYKLAKAPSEYTIGAILRITEGSLAPIACLEDEPNQCPRFGDCATIAFWQGLYQAINDYVDGTTLEQLLDSAKQRAAYEFNI
ncbi:MAG: RrF2 family transcriptional regulator [Oscillospiraceae bacterium]|jgi:Rrf2 family protein